MSEGAIRPGLAAGLSIPREVAPEVAARFATKFSGTSKEERLSLYSVCRHAYSGEGAVFDIGCGPGGSSRAMALGLAANPAAADRTVDCFDIFDGYCRHAARPFLPQGETFGDDLAVFRHVTEDVARHVRPHKVDLTRDFARFRPAEGVEIAHVDAAKSLDLWTAIVDVLGRAVIPGKTIWIFQDFERARLAWQIYGLARLLPFGEFVGAAHFGTMYFRFLRPVDEDVVRQIVADDFTLAERLSGIDAVWAHVFPRFADGFAGRYDPADLHRAYHAFVHHHLGHGEEATAIYACLSAPFRNAPEHQGFEAELARGLPRKTPAPAI